MNRHLKVGKRQRSEVRGQRSEDYDKKIRGEEGKKVRRAEVRGQRSEGGEIRSQRSGT